MCHASPENRHHVEKNSDPGSFIAASNDCFLEECKINFDYGLASLKDTLRFFEQRCYDVMDVMDVMMEATCESDSD